MAVHGGAACLKYSMFVFNLIFFIGGAIVLGVGIWVLVDSSSFKELTMVGADAVEIDNYNTPAALEQAAIVLIVAGGLVFLISFLGCCGAYKEWRPFLVIYAFLLIVILLMEIAAGIAAAVFKGHLDSNLKIFMNETMRNMYTYKGDKLTDTWDLMQTQLECCGINAAADFNSIKQPAGNWNYTFVNPNLEIPYSCCKLKDKNAAAETNDNRVSANCGAQIIEYHPKGCYEQLEDFIEKYAEILMIIGIVFGVLQLFGIIIACCLCKAIGKAQNSV